MFADSVLVTVVQRSSVSIVGLSPKYCLNVGNVTMSGSPSGGVFSGPGVAGNIFNPSVIGIGRWCITYTYTDLATGCSSDTVVCVVVDSLPTLRVSGYSSSYCHLDSPVMLAATPSGGTYSGAGIDGSIFYPANANSGNNVITYTYTDTVLGCSNSIQFTINIKDVPSISAAASESPVCPGTNVSLSAQYSTDVFNIAWSDINGGTIYSGLNAFTVNPSAANHCYIATAVNTPGCVTRDTLCVQLMDCYANAIDEPCDMDTVYMNNPITVRVLDNDTIPAGSDTVIIIKTTLLYGSAGINSDHSITYIPEQDFSGYVEFTYQVCVDVKGFEVCDTANVCITVVDTTIHCHFPNTITPNNDGSNDEFEISCNDRYPNADIRIYSRWGAEVFRSFGHYDNKWNGYNQQGTKVPDGTYFYMYYFNDGSNRMKKGFVDVYR
jgi:gliding motility-associated-like protein